MTNEIEFTDANFSEEVLGADVPVLVDFWAPWCGPCKMIAPMVEEISNEYAGKVKVGKLNIDDNQTVASQYGVQGIPTLMIFKNGEMVERIVGVRPKETLTGKLESVLAS